MSQATVKICYGLQIPTFDLLVAANASQLLAGPLLALDLIALRLHRRTLRTNGSANGTAGAAGIPLEVWEMVRHELVETELAARTEDFIGSFRCPNCSSSKPFEWVQWEKIDCGDCVDTALEGYDTVAADRSISEFTSHYGLELAGEVNPVEILVFEAVSVVSLILPFSPPATEPSISPAASNEFIVDNDGTYGPPPTSLALLPTALVSHPSFDTRFRALISTYHLKVLTSDLPSFLPLPHAPLPALASPNLEGATKAGDAAGPRWMLVLSCELD